MAPVNGGQTVTAADLKFEWCCESCDRPFRLGHQAFGVIVGVTSDGTPIEGDYRCQDCWDEGS